MSTDFQISAIDASIFESLFHSTSEELLQLGALKMVADQNPGYQCRVSLEDAAVGEEVILLNYEHHAVASPYRSTGPIFIKPLTETAKPAINEIPAMLDFRFLSLRVYDQAGMMVDEEAKAVPGKRLREAIVAILANAKVGYIQIHNAGHGCYVCQVNRVDN